MLSDHTKHIGKDRRIPVTSLISKIKTTFHSLNKKLILPILLIAVAVIGVGVAAVNLITPKNSSLADTRIDIKGPKSTKAINEEFSFPIKDAQGKEVTKLRLFLDTAELRDEVIIKGEKAYPVKGKTFFVVDMRFRNNYNLPIEIKAIDYIRLEINGDKENQLAPDIHNDPVTIQPLSTKQVRLGFFINDTDKNTKLYVGELTGKKKEIPVSF